MARGPKSATVGVKRGRRETKRMMMTGVLPSTFLIFFKEWLVQQYWLCLSPATFYLGERSVCLPTWNVREIVMEHLKSSKKARLSSKALSYVSLWYFSYRAIFSPSTLAALYLPSWRLYEIGQPPTSSYNLQISYVQPSISSLVIVVKVVMAIRVVIGRTDRKDKIDI